VIGSFERAAAQVSSDYAHGHDELVLPNCALCVAELNAVIDWRHQAEADGKPNGGVS
jgi:hypothetical protein